MRFSGGCEPPQLPRFACGVASKEQTRSLVRGADVGSSDNTPLRVIPEAGQISDYTACCP